MLLYALTTHEGTPIPSSEVQWGWTHSLLCFLCCQDASGEAGEDKKERSLSQAPLMQVALREEQFHLHSWVLQRVIMHRLHLELMVRSCPLHWMLSLGLWVITGARSLRLGIAVLDAADKPSDSSPWISHIHSTPVTEYLGWQSIKVLQARSRASQAAEDAGETKLCHASWPASGRSAAKARYQRCWAAGLAAAP